MGVKYYDDVTFMYLGTISGILVRAGDFVDVKPGVTTPEPMIQGFSVWKTSKPVLLSQYSNSYTWDEDENLDPFMIEIAPVNSGLSESLVSVPSTSGYTRFCVNLIIKADTNDPNYTNNLKYITVNGKPVWNDSNAKLPRLLDSRLPGTNLHCVRLQMNVDKIPYHITAPKNITFTGYIYGYGRADGFGTTLSSVHMLSVEGDTVAPEVGVDLDTLKDTTFAIVTDKESSDSVGMPVGPQSGIAYTYVDSTLVNARVVSYKETKKLGYGSRMRIAETSVKIAQVDRTKDASARVVSIDNNGNQRFTSLFIPKYVPPVDTTTTDTTHTDTTTTDTTHTDTTTTDTTHTDTTTHVTQLADNALSIAPNPARDAVVVTSANADTLSNVS